MPKNTSGLVAAIQPNTFSFNFTSLVGQTNHFGIVRTMQCSPQTLYSRIFWGHPLDLSGISMESSSHCWYWQILLVCWGDLQGVWGALLGHFCWLSPGYCLASEKGHIQMGLVYYTSFSAKSTHFDFSDFRIFCIFFSHFAVTQYTAPVS